MITKSHIYFLSFVICFSVQAERSYGHELWTSKVSPSAFVSTESTLDRPVAAWIDYCRRHSDDCQIDLKQPLAVKLTPAVLQKIKVINTAVNATVQPMTDLRHWGVEDHWDRAEDGYGDCEDYQLLKRKLLIDAGIPRRTMLMTVVWDADHNGHALLMIRTNVGDLVLDNESPEVLLWKDTPYVYLKRESQFEVGWVPIDPAPAVMSALR